MTFSASPVDILATVKRGDLMEDTSRAVTVVTA